MATAAPVATSTAPNGNGITSSLNVGAQPFSSHPPQSKSLGYFLVEAKYGSKLVVKQQLVELNDTDTFRTLLLRVLKHEALQQRGDQLRLQVGFKLGSDLITVPSSDEIISVVLQRFPDIKSLQYTIQPFESEYIKIEPIKGAHTRRTRLFQVLGWVVRIVGSYELLLLVIRLGLRLAGVGPQLGPDTDMVETMAIAEALLDMNSEQLDEVKEMYDLGTEEWRDFKKAIQDERKRRGLSPAPSDQSGKGQQVAAAPAARSEAKGKPWVSSGEEDDDQLDGTFGKDAVSDYDETAKQ